MSQCVSFIYLLLHGCPPQTCMGMTWLVAVGLTAAMPEMGGDLKMQFSEGFQLLAIGGGAWALLICSCGLPTSKECFSLRGWICCSTQPHEKLFFTRRMISGK